MGFWTCCLFAGGEGVSGPESSIFSGFPCSSAPVVLHWCSSHWNRILYDGACKGRCFFLAFLLSSTTPLCATILCFGSISIDIGTYYILNWKSCLDRGVYFGICVFLVWAQQRELLSMLLQWKSWRDYTHWTWSHWTSKDLEKDPATARDR